MNLWIVVPAAGVGKRFGSAVPKQYLTLAGKLVIEHTLERLLALQPQALLVAISNEDRRWPMLGVSGLPGIRTVTGGAERADTVRLALAALQSQAVEDDWVLVHDVARPCVRVADIQALQARLAGSSVGGILAAPVSDTLKIDDGESGIEATADRNRFWAAMTPQMFRYGLLRRALEHCREAQVNPTDEAMAVELLGYRPALVEGRRDNIKITRPEDMAMAATILAGQRAEGRDDSDARGGEETQA